jgi:hypothetical protein
MVVVDGNPRDRVGRVADEADGDRGISEASAYFRK